jgi:hypothetical protein
MRILLAEDDASQAESIKDWLKWMVIVLIGLNEATTLSWQ